MTGKYRIDPNFVVPEPTAANMFGFCELDKFDDAERERQGDWMREAGAQQMRVTIVSEEYPNDPYPHGYWFEGWADANARQLPFGEAEESGGAIWPPLTYENGKLASADTRPEGGDSTEIEAPFTGGAVTNEVRQTPTTSPSSPSIELDR